LDIFTSVKACDFNYRLFQHSTKKCCGVEPKDIIIFNSILSLSIICYFIKVKKPLYNIWSALWVSFHQYSVRQAFARPFRHCCLRSSSESIIHMLWKDVPFLTRRCNYTTPAARSVICTFCGDITMPYTLGGTSITA
jgi:hypothetical protein